MKTAIRFAIIVVTAASLCACPALYRKHCDKDGACDTTVLGF